MRLKANKQETEKEEGGEREREREQRQHGTDVKSLIRASTRTSLEKATSSLETEAITATITKST